MSVPGSVLLTNVRPYGEGEPVDVAVTEGLITAIGVGLDAPEGAPTIDGRGGVLLPGLVDLHTHVREPGREDTETIATGSAAAAKGGYTAIFAWPIPVRSPTMRPSPIWSGASARKSDSSTSIRSVR